MTETVAEGELNMNTNKQRIQRITAIGLLSAMVIVLQFVSMALRFSAFSITLTLIPIVVGAALYGVGAGAWLGLIFGTAVLLTGDAAAFLVWNIPGTIITVLAKGILAGVASGLVFKLLEKKNRYLAVIVSAVACPVVNTGIFLIGCLTFFLRAVRTMALAEGLPIFAYLIVGFVGLNFVFELVTNIIVSPAILRIINIRKK